MRPQLAAMPLSASLCVLACGPVAAQQALAPALSGEGARLNESYDKERDVTTGTPLVALIYGDAPGSYPIAGATLAAPRGGLGADERVCVHQTSKDGRYSSANPYAAPDPAATPVSGAGSEAGRGDTIDIAPLSQAFAIDLEGYPANDMGFLAYKAAGEACGTKDALYLPRIVDPAGPLRLFAASRARSVQAALGGADDGVVQGVCAPVDRPAVTYDVACRFDALPASPDGSAMLRLSFDDGFDVETRTYDVQLPGGASR